MEARKIYITNFDYEKALYDQNYHFKNSKNTALREGLCPLIFFDRPNQFQYLLTNHNPEDDFYQYLRNYLDIQLPIFVPDNNLKKSDILINWWGELKNINLEQKLNSKIYNHEMAIKIGLPTHFSKIIRNENDLLEYQELFKKNQHQFKNQKNLSFMIRTPYLFSGIGNQIIKSIHSNTTAPYPYLIAPFYQRLLDFGLNIIDLNLYSHDQFYSSLNISENNSRGMLQSITTFKNGEIAKKLISPLYLENIKKMKDIYLPLIINEILPLGPKGHLSIDNFIFKDNSSPSLYPAIELNYRKTMGLLLQKFKKYIPEDGTGTFFFKKNKKRDKYNFKMILSKLSPYLYNSKQNKGIILTTCPIESQFFTYFVSGKTTSEIKKISEIVNNI